jgi:hypothetical protein
MSWAMVKPAPAYLVTGPDGHDYWLMVPLDNKWTAAYRLAYHGDGAHRRARICELRIVRCRPGDFHPRIDFEKWGLHPLSKVPRPVFPPFSFEAVRHGITARLFADALAAVPALIPPDDAPEEWGGPASRLESTRPRRGRPVSYSPEFYAEFAVRYHNVEHDERRERSASTRALLAKRYKVPLTTIGKWIRIARQRGFLTRVVRGQRGGMATHAARALTKRGQA